MDLSHDEAVATVSRQVQEFHRRQQPFRIYHGSTNSTRDSPYGRDNIVDTAHLTHVLQVDPIAQTVLAEPNVPMDQLVRATLVHNLVPLVVMEFPGITAGGGFSGTSGESSSFRHGFFDATVNWIEIVLPDGEVRRASQSDDPELFWGAASAFGTLGIVTLVEIQCRPAKPFVELAYHSASDMDQAMQVFRRATADPTIEYLDGIVFAKNHVVVCAGRLVDSPPEGRPVQRFTRAQDPWFYIHAQRRSPAPSSGSNTPPSAIHYIPLEDYLFRYDRGAFWTGRFAYQYFITPFNRITRYVLDFFMHTRVMYHALHQSGLSSHFIIQDVAVPYHATRDFIDWLDHKDSFGSYPIWLCPLRHSEGVMSRTQDASHANTETNSNPDPDAGYIMNFGLWAPSPFHNDRQAFIAQNRRLEGKVRQLGGKKWLYAHAYYTEDEFWSIYDKKRYDMLRAKYRASYLPDLYQKVRVNLVPGSESASWESWIRGLFWSVWPVSGLYGVYKAWRGGEYLIRK
ncbi:FAD-binding oxidoreductase [Aspergillus affinis]|uniref:FAD-binding oxidoreductase n=1 Tax=Aspergillus affinis TaxID=1070780 RepID=UPI0022FE8340|nr:FAD binding domain protein [Aspergillus affinis]KAI9039699.1 FAD binding domain protein [Aspergillus affinis]